MLVPITLTRALVNIFGGVGTQQLAFRRWTMEGGHIGKKEGHRECWDEIGVGGWLRPPPCIRITVYWRMAYNRYIY